MPQSADQLILTAICNALIPLAPGGRVYQGVAVANAARPHTVVQLQDDVRTAHVVGRGGAATLVTVKVIANTQAEARTIRDTLCPVVGIVPTLSTFTIAGFSVTVEWERTPTLPYDGSAYQAGQTFRVALRHIP